MIVLLDFGCCRISSDYQTGEKLQQNAQQTGSDTQREIAGKINIKVIIHDANDVFMYFESSPEVMYRCY